jgi:hypothetical protein
MLTNPQTTAINSAPPNKRLCAVKACQGLDSTEWMPACHACPSNASMLSGSRLDWKSINVTMINKATNVA